MCRRPDVGLGNVRIPGSCCRYHGADSLALEHTIAKIDASGAAKSSGRIAEWCRGALNMATERILIITDADRLAELTPTGDPRRTPCAAACRI